MLNSVTVLANLSFELMCNTVDFQLMQTIIHDKYNMFILYCPYAHAHATRTNTQIVI